MKKRVVVTGVGCLTPLGLDSETTWHNIISGRSGIKILDQEGDAHLPVRVAAKIKDFEPTLYIDKKESRRMDRFIQLAMVSALQAAEDGDLRVDENIDPARIGVWVGSGVGGVQTFEKSMHIVLEKGYNRLSPFSLPMYLPNMASSQIAIKLGAQGITSCTTTACSSGSNSIGEAFRVIQRGDADAMLAGGTEAAICPIGLASFTTIKALSFNPDPLLACRPFDRLRDGFVMGEGAGIVLLEEREHAVARGAKIYAEVAGYGANCDSYHITAPRPNAEGWSIAMKLALTDAELSAEDIDYINAHGTSTTYNDLCETRGIKQVFGQCAFDINVSSTKSMTGHLLGAAGAVEAIFSVLAIRDQIVPPTINYENPDEELNLNYTPNRAHQRTIDTVMSNSFAFGGHNAVLVFQKYLG